MLILGKKNLLGALTFILLRDTIYYVKIFANEGNDYDESQNHRYDVRALQGVPGVTEVTVDQPAGTAQVQGGEPAALIAAVKAAGYDAEEA